MLAETATYRDSNALLQTSSLHHHSTQATQNASADAYPAIDDPAFVHQALETGDLTTKPGTRGSLFYQLANADPIIVAEDEATTQTVVLAELTTGHAVLNAEEAAHIHEPVLLAVGQYDNVVCLPASGATNCSTAATVLAAEQPFYPQTSLATFVLPGAGHGISLHRNAGVWFAEAIRWCKSLRF